MPRVEQPNVVPVHALGPDGGGRPVLVMTCVHGAAPRDLLRDPSHDRWPTLGYATTGAIFLSRAFALCALNGVVFVILMVALPDTRSTDSCLSVRPGPRNVAAWPRASI